MLKAPQKAVIKSVFIAAAGVMLAGFAMNYFRGNSAVDRARVGFQ